MKKISISLLMLSFLYAGGDNTAVNKNGLSKNLDKNGYKNISEKCKEIEVSGVIEIKNKNLDYDKNKVFFKHQRITYVIPDENSDLIKECIKERSTGINEVNMKKLIKELE